MLNNRMRAFFVFLFGLLLGVDMDAASVRVRPLTAPAFPVARFTAGPAGTLTCLDWKTHGVKGIAANGDTSGVQFAVPADARITNVGGGDGRTVLTTATHGTLVLDQDGSVVARFAPTRFTPYVAAATDRRFAFGIGSAGDASGRVQADWLVTRVDLEKPDAAPRDLVTDDQFADPFARSIYPLGYLLVSADRATLYALWEGSTLLHVIPTAGGSPRTIPVTEGADAPTRATSAMRSAALSDPQAFYRLRSGYRWPQGLLRGPGDAVVILFREPASRGFSFTIDIYSREGRKIGSKLPVDLQPRSATAHARVVTATDGRQYVLVNEPNSDLSGVQNQTFYAIDLRP